VAKTLKIGLAQCRQTGEFAMNADTIRRCLDEARHAAVQILCFPETQTVGYRVDISTPTRPVPVAELEDLHAEVARFCGREGMACVLGTETPLAADPHRGKPYDSALVISETGAILGAHHKTKLPPSTRWPTRREGRSRRSTCSA
jgi:predicted amidohydrolase